MHYTGPAKIADISEKKAADFMPGDLLFSTRKGELVSQDSTDGSLNELIGICVSEKTFMSVRFLSYSKPDSGIVEYNSEYRFMDMLTYGFHNINLVSTYNKKTKQNNQITCGAELFDFGLSLMNKKCDISNWYKGPLFYDDKNNVIGSTLFISAWRFHTKGTKRGNWYIPCVKELIDMCHMKQKFNPEKIEPYLNGIAFEIVFQFMLDPKHRRILFLSCEDYNKDKRKCMVVMNTCEDITIEKKDMFHMNSRAVPLAFLKVE